MLGNSISCNAPRLRDSRAHSCNCIGCCSKCGQCRTAPWHARTCDKIAALNAERARLIADAWL